MKVRRIQKRNEKTVLRRCRAAGALWKLYI